MSDFNQPIYVMASGLVKRNNLVWLILYTRLATFATLEGLPRSKLFGRIECTSIPYVLICSLAVAPNTVTQSVAACRISTYSTFSVRTLKSQLRSCLSPCTTTGKCSSSILLSAWIALFISFRIVCDSIPLSRMIMPLSESLITSLKSDATAAPSLPRRPSSWWALACDCEVVAAVVAIVLVRDWCVLSHFCCKSSLSFWIAGCRSTFPVDYSIESMTSRYTVLEIDFGLLLIRNSQWRLSWSLREYVCLFALKAASTNKAGNSAFFPSLLAEILSEDSYSLEELLGSFQSRFMLHGSVGFQKLSLSVGQLFLTYLGLKTFFWNFFFSFIYLFVTDYKWIFLRKKRYLSKQKPQRWINCKWIRNEVVAVFNYWRNDNRYWDKAKLYWLLVKKISF